MQNAYTTCCGLPKVERQPSTISVAINHSLQTLGHDWISKFSASCIVELLGKAPAGLPAILVVSLYHSS